MVDVIPKLFITGSEYRIIVTDRSCDDLCDSNQLSKDELSFNKIKWIHSLDSTRLIANMFRYANGQSLNIPKYLNDERPPFWAFKDKTPPPNESFDQFREKAQNDMAALGIEKPAEEKAVEYVVTIRIKPSEVNEVKSLLTSNGIEYAGFERLDF